MSNDLNRVKILERDEVVRAALLWVEQSIAGNGNIVVGDFTPLRTGFQDRLNVPMQTALRDVGTGAFLELTREQAIGLRDALSAALGAS